MKKYRNQGAIGALLDEYERAIIDLERVIIEVSREELVCIVDQKTQDPDCRSIQTILAHVVCSGYGYAIVIRKFLGEKIAYKERALLPTTQAFIEALKTMFAFNEKLFKDYPNLKLEELDNQKKIQVRWGQLYDIEQLLEHAIVHILRHRRQIERFLIKLR